MKIESQAVLRYLTLYALAVLFLLNFQNTASACVVIDDLRPYGPTAAWNMPVSDLPTDPKSNTLVHKLWTVHSMSVVPGNINLSFRSYTYPVYHASCASKMYPVRSRYGWGNLVGKMIPWNPDWKPSSGSDAQAIVLDQASGKEWNLWQVAFDGARVTVSNGNLVPGDYRTKTDGFRPSRGVGIQYLAMLVRPEEISNGVIEHALSMPIKNAGSSFVAPGTKSDGRSAAGVPEGTRFAVMVTDEEITTWVNTVPQQMRAAARVIAVALRDYGMIVTDTSGGAHLQFEDWAAAGDQWKALGLSRVYANGKEYPRDLLDGLLKESRIRAIVPSNLY